MTNATETQQPQEPAWLTVPQVAAVVQTRTRSVYKAIEAKKLRASRINQRGDWRVHRTWIDEWLNEAATHDIENQRPVARSLGGARGDQP